MIIQISRYRDVITLDIASQSTFYNYYIYSCAFGQAYQWSKILQKKKQERLHIDYSMTKNN